MNIISNFCYCNFKVEIKLKQRLVILGGGESGVGAAVLGKQKQFDVFVKHILFVDLLCDISAMITGSLGMLPSASIGEKNSLYEPVHGSAPDLAGRNLANPIAAILSIAMMLGITFKEKKISADIYKAVKDSLEDGIGTIDIIKDEKRAMSTTDFTDKIINRYRSIVEN